MRMMGEIGLCIADSSLLPTFDAHQSELLAIAMTLDAIIFTPQAHNRFGVCHTKQAAYFPIPYDTVMGIIRQHHTLTLCCLIAVLPAQLFS